MGVVWVPSDVSFPGDPSVLGLSAPSAGATESALLLADLSPGARVQVVEVISTGEEAAARRLVELGFSTGSVVEVVRRAPLRDPVIYRVKDYDVCLRRAQAALVRVREVPG